MQRRRGLVWLNLGEILRVHAKNYPEKEAVKDWHGKSRTYADLDSRTNRLANTLLSMGLHKGDRLAVMLYNCVEYVEICCACAKIGVVVVTVNWRFISKEVELIVNNADARAFILDEEFVDCVNSVRQNLQNVSKGSFVVVGQAAPTGYINYEDLAEGPQDSRMPVKISSEDAWFQIYTSGTTGIPKGVVRSHESYISFFLTNAIEFGFSQDDKGMIVMPLYHVNSTFYGLLFLYIGASLYVGADKGFDPVELLRVIDEEKVTFVSLIPTHYHLILSVPDDLMKSYDLSSMRSFLCSSAPVRSKIKKGILKCFPDTKLYEAYGSTEAGLVTILRPEDQLRKLGSMGRECLGTDIIKLLDGDGNEVAVGEVGELYSSGPMMFDEYYKMPEKTKESFRGNLFTARDMAKRDEEGYYYIVDRKDNMIITGGEHVYPSEIEEIISKHPKVSNVAVIGLPDDKWGEAVKAIVILNDGVNAGEEEIIEWCRGRMAGFKKPKSVDFISASEMPRTTTGKILHRKLRERYASSL
ncbi:MAG: AMP-binding protein [Candidatus Bathyarchaeota archaeon]|nr:MAG: AMP-binding protein [Candidatus Bathyarchaeota archaeon]